MVQVKYFDNLMYRVNITAAVSTTLLCFNFSTGVTVCHLYQSQYVYSTIQNITHTAELHLKTTLRKQTTKVSPKWCFYSEVPL